MESSERGLTARGIVWESTRRWPWGKEKKKGLRDIVGELGIEDLG